MGIVGALDISTGVCEWLGIFDNQKIIPKVE